MSEPGQLQRQGAAAISAPLEAIAAAGRELARGSDLVETLEAITAAAASATGAELVIARVLEPDRRFLSARAVFTASAVLAAELSGSRISVDELDGNELDELSRLPAAVRSAAGRAGLGVALVLPVRLRDELVGTLELIRADEAFGSAERAFGRLAADQIASTVRTFERDGGNGVPDVDRSIELAGEALQAGSAEAIAEDLARLAVRATDATACLLWLGEPTGSGNLELMVALGPDLAADELERLRRLAAEAVDRSDVNVRESMPGSGAVATVQLGQPAIGALQLVFDEGAAPAPSTIEAIAGFGRRAARALRASERARTLELELERTRALLGVVAQTNEQLSLAHTLGTAVERVAELLGVERLGVYLMQDGHLAAAEGRGLTGRHAAIAERMLGLALGPFRGRGMLQVEDALSDTRLAGLSEELAETGIEAAVAAPLVVPDEVIGLLALYPRRGRMLTSDEWTLLGALVAQLAVAVQNAGLHERATRLGAELENVLSLERQAARQLRALYEISRAFTQSLSLETTLEAVARTVVELLAVDAAVIRMPDERGELLVPRALHVADARLDDAIRVILLRPQPVEKLPGRRLFRMGRPLVVDEHIAQRLDADRPLVPFLQKGSTAVVLPIATPAELLGTLTILSLDPARPITDDTTEIALSVAGQAALAIDNARLYQQQKEFSDAMQHSLLPRSQPELPGLELGDVYESSARVDVGGDLYDFMTLDDGRLAVCLGDVTGHGIDAAADMAMAKFVFRSLAREHPDPGDFLAAANQVVCGEIEPGKFISMLYLTIDSSTGELACASAGHPPPLVVGTDGAVRAVEAGGVVLGIDEDQVYEEVRERLDSGATVVLYTDGVIEARRGGELYGRERLERLLADERALAPAELARAVVADCRAFSRGELVDDCAIVAIRRTG